MVDGVRVCVTVGGVESWSFVCLLFKEKLEF